jgi:hypothetical protein
MGTSNYSDEFKRDAVQQIRVLRVHVSGFYAWLKEPLSRRA